MHIVIFGAGGLGGYIGGRLVEHGQRVTLVARGDHLRAMQSRGLRILSPKGDARLDSVNATDDPTAIDTADVVVVSVKTWQLESAVSQMTPFMGPDTVVLPLLNGVEAHSQLVSALGPDRVLKGTARIISHIAEPGVVRHVGAEPTVTLGEADGRPSERVERVAHALRSGTIGAEISTDMEAVLWEKFLFVVSLGGLGAVTRAPAGVVRGLPETRTMLRRAMEEVHRLATARGVVLGGDLVDRTLAFVDSLPADGTASLQRDIAVGRRSELEAWSGAVVRLAVEAGVATPVHEFVYGALQPLDRRARGEIDFTPIG